MKNFTFLFLKVFALCAILAGNVLAQPVSLTPQSFGRQIILEGGRTKPLDTLARVSLMRFGGSQSIRHEGKSISAADWLGQISGALPDRGAADYPIFRIDHPELKALLGQTEKKRYSIRELAASIGPLSQAAAGLPEDSAKFDVYQKELDRLIKNIGYYYQLSRGIPDDGLAGRLTPEQKTRGAFEYEFNHFNPLGISQGLYLLAMLFLLAGRLREGKLSFGAWIILLIALGLHLFGIAARMYIQERPPVTNLYSSALFVGAIGAGLCLFLERHLRNFLGLTLASILGFATLQIADKLAESGDTLEMMRAVLDSNFWLATHVVVITLGYATMFVACGIAALTVFKRAFGQVVELKPIVGSVYGTICLALLLSFVGTMLGGVWADQSWGRFWGWDPKENGALMIVLWCALILHARWGGIVGPWGILALSLLGGVITAWSWFGTNMLGIGLHSYGFTNAAFWALAGFCAVLVLLACGCLFFGLKSSSEKP